jgi:hypothetical protein
MIFPKTPIIIAMNLNTIDERRNSLGTVGTYIVMISMVGVLRNIKTRMSV